MNVDMATYKAEFLSHYYEGRLRPRHAYAMGWIYWWARLASLMPGLVNCLTHMPHRRHSSPSARRYRPAAQDPVFASQTSRPGGSGGRPRNVGRPRVILWPDTFNNYFHPQTAKAAVEVLEDAGFQVVVPRQIALLRPSALRLRHAPHGQGLLREILDTLRPEIAAGTPIVGLEPSCVAVFRDEMTNLFPMDEDARRLSAQTFVLSEFLEKKAPHYRLPQLQRKALVQKHCHHEHVMKFDAENSRTQEARTRLQAARFRLLRHGRLLRLRERALRDLQAIGERVLLPAVRQADEETLIIADGFSCREQIAGLTGRGALHLAQVIEMAMHEGPAGPSEPLPERYYQPLGQREPAPSPQLTVGVFCLGALIGAALAWKLSEKRRPLRPPLPRAPFLLRSSP